MIVVKRVIDLEHVNIEELSLELTKKVSRVNKVKLLNHGTGALELECNDNWNSSNDSELDQSLADHDALIDTGFVIEDLLPGGLSDPPGIINYKTALSSSLHPKRTFKNGFVTKVKYFKTRNEDETFSDQVLEVDVIYESKEDAIHDSAKTVKKRTTTRRWNRKDGTLDDSEKKVTEKYYPHITESRKEGRRRRDNIFNIASKDIVILLMFTQTAGDQESAEQLGLSLVGAYSKEFNNFTKVAAAQQLIDVINADALSGWLDNVVPTNPTAQYLVPHAIIGETIRAYIIRSFSGIL